MPATIEEGFQEKSVLVCAGAETLLDYMFL